MKKSLKIILLVVLLAAFAVLAVSCGAKSYDSYAPNDYGSGTDDSEKADSFLVDLNRKIIYNVTLRINADDLETLGADVRKNTADFGGYMQSSREYVGDGYTTNEYVVRIPTENLEEFLAAMEDGREIASKVISTQDITNQYVSAEARKEALESEKSALLALMENGTSTIEEIIAVHDRLSEINAELGAIEKQLNEYDSLVNYSTVTITASRAYEKKDDRSFGQKLSDLIVSSFKSVGTFFKGLLIGITAALPYLILIAIIAGIVLGIVVLVRVKQGKTPLPPCKKRKKAAKIEKVEEKKTEGDEK